jgi:hypothetical protein
VGVHRCRPAEPDPGDYLRRREHGDGHPAALRQLFNCMLGQLHDCLATGAKLQPVKAFPGTVSNADQPADD